MDVERLIERLHATAKNLRAIGELPPEMSVFFGPNLPEEAAAALAKLHDERDEANQRALANNVLSHGWMVAHDCLKAGLPYTYPSPADVPNIIRERDHNWQEYLDERSARMAENNRNHRLTEALQPFAVWADKMPDVVPELSADIMNVLRFAVANGHLTGAHFRAASRALGGGE